MEPRAQLTKAQFDAIPIDEDPIYGYYQLLIAENERIFPITNAPHHSRDNELTHGQRVLFYVATFDGQVNNGGIVQFLWNEPELVLPVEAAIRVLGQDPLLHQYQKVLDTFFERRDRWLELRKDWVDGGTNPPMAAFQSSYHLLDLGWFDHLYYDKHGHDDLGHRIILRHGLQYSLQHQLADYVAMNWTDFIADGA